MRCKTGSTVTECSRQNRPKALGGRYPNMGADEIMQTGPPPQRILVVEDNPILLRLSTRMLMDASYHVDAAEDGAVAWDVFQLQSFDLLITDNSMPNVTGLELIEKMRTTGIAIP